MLAAVITAPRHVELRSLPDPEPSDTEVRVQITGCGICGSDLPVWQGRPWFEYPREPGAPGHEAWGVVDAVGSHVNGLRVGDPVSGLMYHCYAERDLADTAQLVRLPPTLGARPFPGEPLACAMNVRRRSGIAAGKVVAVVGVGFLGALLVGLAAGAGAHVIAISRRPCALAAATRLGAEVVLDSSVDVPARVAELTRGKLCDVVIEAAGAQSTLDLASALVRVRGQLVIAGYHQDGLRQVNMQSWNWNGIDVINAHERDPEVYLDGLRLAVAEVASGRLDPTTLFTHELPLDGLQDAFRMLEEHPDGFMKGLVLTA